MNPQQNRYPRPLEAPNRLSKRMRRVAIDPDTIPEIERALSIYFPLNFLNLTSLYFGVPDESLLQAEEEIGAYLYHMLTYSDEDIAPRRARYTIRPLWTSVAEAEQALETDQNFERTFGLKPSEARYFSSILFPPPHDVVRVAKELKLGSMSSEEATLMIFAKLRHSYETEEDLAVMCGRSEGFISTLTTEALDQVYTRFSRLLCLDQLPRFSAFLPAWKEAVRNKFNSIAKLNYSSLPERFEGVGVFLDCVRCSAVARPSRNQGGFTGDQSLTRLVITSPCGLFLAISDSMPGRYNNEMDVANACEITQHLAAWQAKAMTDKCFRNNNNTIAALPRSDEYHGMVDDELYPLSAIRTAGVEWPFGQLKEAFPCLIQTWNQKLYQTSKGKWFSVAMILSNMVRMHRGCNGNTYFDLSPAFASVEEYISGLS